MSLRVTLGEEAREFLGADGAEAGKELGRGGHAFPQRNVMSFSISAYVAECGPSWRLRSWHLGV
jgi:hypothetical protein